MRVRTIAGTDRSERSLRVERGEVVCPRRGPIDIVDCWVCGEYRGLADGRVESVVCGLSEETLASTLWMSGRDPGPVG